MEMKSRLMKVLLLLLAITFTACTPQATAAASGIDQPKPVVENQAPASPEIISGNHHQYPRFRTAGCFASSLRTTIRI